CDFLNQLPRCALQMRTNLIQDRHADRGASQRFRWPAGNGAAPDRRAAWHKPLYRQPQIMVLQGLPVDRATLAGWVGVGAAELKPVYLRMKEILLGAAKIAVDETRAPVLDPSRGGTKSGYFWGIARDDRPWGGS